MKITKNFHCERKLSCAITKSTVFAVSKDEWDTKKDFGKSLKNALYIEVCKRHISGRSNVEQRKKSSL